MPVNMSNALTKLFPAGAVAVELREPGDVASLLPAEAAYLGRAVAKRAQEFAAGRQCARRALAEFGVVNFPLGVAVDRRPLWPDFMTGSITHTAGLCVVAVAERARLKAMGIDSEVIGAVQAHLWPTICVPQELAWLDSLTVAARSAAATLLFSAKEAFYKCQYPLIGKRLGFHDVYIEPANWGEPDGVFRVRPHGEIAVLHAPGVPLTGRYLFHEQFVSTAVAAGGL